MKPRYLGNHASQMKSYYGTLWGSHGRSFRIRQEKSPVAPPVEKSRWSHIRLAIKPRYLGNLASQIKSYYRTLSGSHGRTFRIRHEKSREASAGGEIMMTSYPAGNKTSLYRKLCIPDKKLLLNTMVKSWSLFQNPSWKIAWSTPCGKITMAWYLICNININICSIKLKWDGKTTEMWYDNEMRWIRIRKWNGGDL